jgi:hypothetical protein
MNIRAGLVEPLGGHMAQLFAPDAGHGVTGLFNVCSAEIQSCFGTTPSFYAPIYPFWIGNVDSLPLYIGSIYFLNIDKSILL